MDTRTAVINRLILLCGERGWTVNHLANVSGVSTSTVKSILYGNSKNPGITLNEFFSGREFETLEQEIK